MRVGRVGGSLGERRGQARIMGEGGGGKGGLARRRGEEEACKKIESTVRHGTQLRSASGPVRGAL